MAVATQKCSAPTLLAHPAGKGCPRKREEGRRRGEWRNRLSQRERERDRRQIGKGLKEGKERSAVRWEGGIPGAHSGAMSGGPTVQ